MPWAENWHFKTPKKTQKQSEAWKLALWSTPPLAGVCSKFRRMLEVGGGRVSSEHACLLSILWASALSEVFEQLLNSCYWIVKVFHFVTTKIVFTKCWTLAHAWADHPEGVRYLRSVAKRNAKTLKNQLDLLKSSQKIGKAGSKTDSKHLCSDDTSPTSDLRRNLLANFWSAQMRMKLNKQNPWRWPHCPTCFWRHNRVVNSDEKSSWWEFRPRKNIFSPPPKCTANTLLPPPPTRRETPPHPHGIFNKKSSRKKKKTNKISEMSTKNRTRGKTEVKWGPNKVHGGGPKLRLKGVRDFEQNAKLRTTVWKPPLTDPQEN